MNLSEIPVVIFCGGRGARFDAETTERPKPLIEVAGKPIVRHIIDGFYAQGFREFILPFGYLGDRIVEFVSGVMRESLDVDITAVDTGRDSHVGERLWRVRDEIGSRRFVMTYGDGLSDVRMSEVIEKHDKTATGIWWGDERPDDPDPALITLTAVRPPSRFGSVIVADMVGNDPWGVGRVLSFQEKPSNDWINGGFAIVERRFIDSYLALDSTTGTVPRLESEAMHRCAEDGFMRAHRHTGYWRCMDTRRDREQIEEDVRRLGHLPWL